MGKKKENTSFLIALKLFVWVCMQVGVCVFVFLYWMLVWLSRQADSSLLLALHSPLLSCPPGFRQTALPVFSLWFIKLGLTSVNTCQSILPIREHLTVGCVPFFNPHMIDQCIIFTCLCFQCSLLGPLLLSHLVQKPFPPACLWTGVTMDGGLELY